MAANNIRYLLGWVMNHAMIVYPPLVWNPLLLMTARIEQGGTRSIKQHPKVTVTPHQRGRQAAYKWKTPPEPEERQASSKWKTPPEESQTTYASKQNYGKRLDGPGWLHVDNGFGRHTGAALYTPLLIQPVKHSRKTPMPQEVRITTRSKAAIAPAPAQKGKGRATGNLHQRESQQPKERRSRLIKLIIIWFFGINLASYCM